VLKSMTLAKMENKQKIFHANLLKKYLSASPLEPSDESTTRDSASAISAITCAAILEPEEETSEDATKLQTLNPLQKETIKDVKINQDLSGDQQFDVRNLLSEFKDIFTDVPSTTSLEEHRIHLTTLEPIRGKAYSLPHAMRETLDKEIDSMLKMGVIEPSSAAYASPVQWSW